MMGDKRKILIIAGEPSGDAHGAKLARALREMYPRTEFEIFGAAGSSMREEGVEAISDADKMAVVGGPEIARELPMFLRQYRKLKAAARERRPDAVVLIDFPDFNLRFAKTAKKMGLKVIYYVSPQIWAWRSYRIRTMRDCVERILVILPFEKKWYEERGVLHATYVGNPLAGEVAASTERRVFLERLGLDPEKKTVALLPGSRGLEIRNILPELLLTAEKLKSEGNASQFLLALSNNRHESEVDDASERAFGEREKWRSLATLVKGETYNAVAASDAAAVTSGTATMETAILGTPMVIVYKASRVNYHIMRPLVSIDTFGLVNLLAGRKIVKELIQQDCVADKIRDELLRLLDPGVAEKVKSDLAAVRRELGAGGASEEAARAVAKVLGLED